VQYCISAVRKIILCIYLSIIVIILIWWHSYQWKCCLSFKNVFIFFGLPYICIVQYCNAYFYVMPNGSTVICMYALLLASTMQALQNGPTRDNLPVNHYVIHSFIFYRSVKQIMTTTICKLKPLYIYILYSYSK
jgi:hypothetical protein